MHADMKTLGERIRRIREDLGISQSELGDRVGMKQQSIQSIESGGVERPRKLREIARALNTTEGLLLGEDQGPEQSLDDELELTPNASAPQPLTLLRKKIPILGRGAGGVDGMFVLNGEKVGEVLSIPALEHVADAYAVYVFGDSMEPRYFSGEIVYVDPARPPARGEFVVVQMKPKRDGDPPFGFIKRYVRWNAENLVLEQYNPAREVHFPSEDVYRVHVIVGSVKG